MEAFSTDMKAAGENSTAKAPQYQLSPAWLTGTGLTLAVIIFAISFTASRRRQQAADYRTFLNVHYLYYLYLPVLIMHIPGRLYVLGVLVVLFAMHEWLEHGLTTTGRLSDCSIVGATTSRLVAKSTDVPNVDVIGTMPGTYYKINVPALSRTEWHPFSLTSSRAGLWPEFFIESLGQWTTQLWRLLKRPNDEQKNHTVKVRGPYYAPAVNAVGQKRPVCVAAGIGITPFLGILHHFVYKHSSSKLENNKDQLLHNRRAHVAQKRRSRQSLSSIVTSLAHLVSFTGKVGMGDGDNDVVGDEEERCQILWVVRDLTLANFLLPYVADLLTLQKEGKPLVRVKVFFTGKVPCDTSCFKTRAAAGGAGQCGWCGANNPLMDSLATNALLLYHFGTYARNGGENSALEFVLGRPNLPVEVRKAKPTAAFYCGGSGLLQRLKVVCQQQTPAVPFHPEAFQNVTLSTWPTFGKKKT